MTRTRVILIALLVGTAPVATSASAQGAPGVSVFASLIEDQQSRDRDRDRMRDNRDRGPDRARDRDRDDRRGSGRSAAPGDAARAVASGRPGRMLGIRPSGGDYVVRWEYPGGRVSDIRVDGQSGRVSGD